MDRIVFLVLLVALGAGVCVGVQTPINSLLNRNIGLLESTFINFVVGAMFSGIALLLGLGGGSLRKLPEAPIYSLLGGFLGVLIVSGAVITIQRLGVAAGSAVLLVGQLCMAAVVDHFGMFGLQRHSISVWTYLGVGLLAAGAYVIRK